MFTRLIWPDVAGYPVLLIRIPFMVLQEWELAGQVADRF